MADNQNDGNVYMVEQVQISSESEGSELLEDVHDLDDFADSINDINDLEKLMTSTLRKSRLSEKTQQPKAKPQPKHVKRLEVVDDFIRNFLIQNNLTKTLTSFQKEWYQYVQNSKHQGEEIPDAYLENEVLKDKYEQIKEQLDNAIIMSDKAKATYDKLLKQRDFHKMHHQRVQKDKKKLNQNIQRLNALQKQYSSKYDELVEKYNFAMKEKMLMKIERDRLKTELTPKKDNILPFMDKTSLQQTNRSGKTRFTPFQTQTTNPFLSKPFEPFQYKQTVLSKTQKAHSMSICSVGFHPKKPIIGTGSDDTFWKIWTINQSQLIMSGEGHKDWVSAVKFHPKGLHIVTASGDSTVKIWDFVNTSCTFTFKDHRQPVWSIDINDSGDYLSTGAMDHSCRILDINVGKCRSVLRGHVDSVNSVHFKPYSTTLASASADKTLSVWDVRTSLCVQTFYGHDSSVNSCKFSPKGDKLASCDSNGIVKSWDVRMGKQLNTYNCQKTANSVSIDRSGVYIAVGCDGGLIHLCNDSSGEIQHILKGHENKCRVLAAEFDMNSKMIVSVGSDCTYRIWQ